MDEYVCLTVRSNPGEGETAFTARMASFWTHMVRNKPDDYEKVYAEATKFETQSDRLTRQYMLEAGVAEVLCSELRGQGVEFDEIDMDEVYSKYEAAPPDWFWLEH